MPEHPQLHKPWLIALWLGMGHVAISARYYLMAKLEMHLLAELSASELFEVEYAEAKGGHIRSGRLPRSRFFIWQDPGGTMTLSCLLARSNRRSESTPSVADLSSTRGR